MNKKEIEDLIRFVSKAGVSEVSLETKEIKITIINTPRQQEQAVTHAVPQIHAAVPATVSAPAPSAKPETPAAKKEPSAAVDESHLHIIKSPMIGTFYRSSSPDKPNFVNVGDEVKPGKIICIIEAMKLFNEIECDITGKIVKVLVDNASPIEYDQPLFLVEPA
ncbi:MAG TPA: acetyl-CoA carboxylase biotin carboxyl carrier protein [Bacteroidia bacterium]|nr:acetyl-CoA carboxylase biotin carboxyl carrier protein [Bacteroidia bacterium]